MAGVVGIDVPVSRFQAFTPRRHLGPLGYTFGLNTNGFLIFHPNLWMISNYLEEPAHHDLEDVEGDSEVIAQLRGQMIDLAAEDGHQHDIRTLLHDTSVILNEGHSATVSMEYFFTSIAQTRFS